MTVGTIANSPLALSSKMLEVTEDSLAIAQQEQAQAILKDQSIQNLSKNVKNTTKLVALDAPESEADGGDFYATMILAMSRLAGLLGDMADSTIIELQFKRTQIKQLLEDKLQSIEDAEQRRKDAIAAQEAIERHRKRAGVFGSVMNFVFGAAEFVSGLFVAAGGILTGNGSLIAGGVSLMAAGTLEMAAELVRVTGGSEKLSDALTSASYTLLAAGIVLSTMGAAGGVSASIIAAKQGAKMLFNEGAQATAKHLINKASKELAQRSLENSAQKASQQAIDQVTKELGATMSKKAVREIALEAGEQAAKAVMDEALQKAVKEASEQAAKAVRENAAEGMTREAIEKAAKEAGEKAAQKVTDEAAERAANLAAKQTVEKYYKKGVGAIVTGNAIQATGNKGYKMYMIHQEHEYETRAAQLEKEIAELGAILDANVQQQEYLNKLIQLLQEQMTRAVLGPVQDALKTLNESIQDRGAVSRRLASSMSV